MQLKILLIVFLSSCMAVCGQEVKINAMALTNAGSNTTTETVNVTKWRLGEVHLVVLNRDDSVEIEKTEWDISGFPNPTQRFLNLEFKTGGLKKFKIQVFDINGSKHLINKEKVITPGQVVQLDLATLASGMYLVSVKPSDSDIQKVFKIQKQ